MILSSLLWFEWFAVIFLYFMYGAYLNTRNKKKYIHFTAAVLTLPLSE